MLAPAKINLYLNVTGKRPDNYHLLDSLIAFTDIFDEIEIAPSNHFSLEITGKFAALVEHDERNIVMRAYRLMAQECSRNDNVAIKLVKNIPVGAGLGGGSADSAATLILLNDLWQAGLSKEKLSEIGLKIGADLPIFINRHAAFVSGIGEKINNTQNLPGLYAILLHPSAPLATKDVFVKFSKERDWGNCSSQAAPTHNITGQAEWLELLKSKSNDLESTAISFLPEIRDILTELSSLDGCLFARMSGSGSTCFAIFTEQSKAQTAFSQLKSKNNNFWIRLAKVTEEY